MLCPLCTKSEFQTVNSLLRELISVSTRKILCPICYDTLIGIDKFTVHLCSHVLKPSTAIEPLNLVDGVCFIKNKLQDISINQITPEFDKSYSEQKILHVDFSDNDLPISIIPESIVSSNITIQNQSVMGISISDDLSNTKNENVELGNICSVCSFTFPNSDILSIHNELVHCTKTGEHKVKPRSQYTCSVCKKSFKMKASLSIHRRITHGDLNESSVLPKIHENIDKVHQQHICHVCDKFFKKEQNLNQHLKTHVGKNWNCDICGKHFTTKYFLNKHKRLHTGEMPYNCASCNKSFTFQQSYHKHLLYHSDLKPYPCDECGKSFKEISTLQNHQRIHTGEKPFSCEICGKCFRQRVSYLVHSRIHTGIKPYKCTGCHKSFRYKVNDRSHKCKADPPGQIVCQGPTFVEKLQSRSMYCSNINKNPEDDSSTTTNIKSDHEKCEKNSQLLISLPTTTVGQHIPVQDIHVKKPTDFSISLQKITKIYDDTINFTSYNPHLKEDHTNSKLNKMTTYRDHTDCVPLTSDVCNQNVESCGIVDQNDAFYVAPDLFSDPADLYKFILSPETNNDRNSPDKLL